MRPDYMAGSSPGENLDAIRHDAYNSGDRKITEKLHSEGSQTARERIISLLDSDTFVEIDALINHRSYDYNLHLHKRNVSSFILIILLMHHILRPMNVAMT